MKLKSIGSNVNEIEIGNKAVLFSYQTPVAYHQEGNGYFRTAKRWSATTTRHINKWLKASGVHPGNVRTVDQSVLDALTE